VEESPGRLPSRATRLGNDAASRGSGQRRGESVCPRLLDQVEIEFAPAPSRRQRSRQTIEPVLREDGGIVAKKLALIEDSKLSDDDRNTRLGDLTNR